MDGKSVRQKLIGDSDERAVSPVIGVILMVAITVILAAVIAAFVLDMGSNQSSPAQAGLDISNNSTWGYDVTVTSIGDSTDTIYCGGTSGNNTDSVGGTFQCAEGENIVATNDNGEETVIQTDI
ncbi:type IV pilin [Natrinema sp. CBA1119]|nr:type IV pilin N-terminal domain-containing protein [Natrinema sp. CBA1119]PGF18251.1 type IV pilin [Natrinema sp. CBA1119]